ncbi:MAG TPA: ABC transporter permease [Candidatus Cybelea sp.]|nr:ABC transporter permease [Candidatus Cybelea sp.]
MKVRDLTELAARNLREALLRNSLTTIGIAVGVASLVSLCSLGVGLQQFADKRLASSGLFNAVFVAPRMNGRFGRDERQAPGSGDRQRALDETARSEILKLPHVVEAYPEIRFTTEILYAGNPYMSMVAGIPESDRTDGAFDGMQGAFFSDPRANEAILQIEFAKQLAAQPQSLIGKNINLRYAEREVLIDGSPNPTRSAKSDPNSGLSPGFSVIPRQTQLRVVGIVETEPAVGFGGIGRGRVLIPEALAEKLSAAQSNDLREILRGGSTSRTFPSLTVLVKTASDVAEAENAIKNMGFSTFSLLDATKNIRLAFTVFDLFLLIFGSLALVVASLGIINTLVMAILERRREIGVLKALGASDRDVRKLFFAEAGAMGCVGGIIGVVLGWLIGQALTFGTNVYLHRQDLPSIQISAVPWWMITMAILFSIVVSLAAGLYPATRAARLNPVEALRYE